MGDSKKTKHRYMKQSVALLVIVTLLEVSAVLFFNLYNLTAAIIVSVIYAAIIEFADIIVWSKVADEHEGSLTTFFMGVSGIRFLSAIAVMFVYFLVSNRGNMIYPLLFFMVYYLSILCHHSLFFLRKLR